MEHLTLLLTDVVDSTQLNDELGDAMMAPLWAEHDQAARELIRTWRGREVGRSDGFFVLFAGPQDALGFALAYHRALRGMSVPLEARVGVHHGPVSLRHNSPADTAGGATPLEVDGVALPTAARVMALALGRQTLFTRDAVQALGDTPLRRVSHGHWRLKGLAEPVEVFEFGEDDAPFLPPPDAPKGYRVVRDGDGWTPVRQVPHNLPTERDPFVGRAEALHEVAALLAGDARLLTILGIGGIGKTRLALRYARAWRGEYPGGVWFCDLSAARSTDGLVHAVAHALDAPLGKSDPVQQIAAALRGRGDCLVILDNFEQIAAHAEGTLGRWLDLVPQARFLVTSREVLGVAGEQTLPLDPLNRDEACTLFLQRMRAAAHPAPDDADLAGIPELVDLIDRLPLAIELAAARARVIPPREQLLRMGERFKLLASRSGRRTRQATMAAALDWGWELLSPVEQSALAQLATFSGGFSIETAEAVVAVDGAWVPDLLQSLVEKSWLHRSEGARWTLLATVQHYAAEHAARLAAAGTAAGQRCATAARRHWLHFAQFTPARATAQRCVEIDNLMLGCRNALAAADHDAAVRCLRGAWACLRLTGPLSAALRLAERALANTDLSPAHRAQVDYIAGSALYLLGQISAARQRLCEALQLAAEDRHLQAETACALGELESTAGAMAEAGPLLHQALSDAQALPDVVLQCRAHNALGALAGDQSDWPRAEAHYLTGLELARGHGDTRWAGVLLGNLGTLHHSLGRADRAAEHYAQAIDIAHRIADRRGEGDRRSNLGLLRLEQGRLAEAQEELQLSLAIARATGHVRLQGTALCNLGLAWEAAGDSQKALAAFSEAVCTASSLEDRRAEGHYRIYLGRTLARSGSLDAATTCLDCALDLVSECGDKQVLGLLHCAISERNVAAGNSETGRTNLELAKTMLLHSGAGLDSELGRELAKRHANAPVERRRD